MKKKVTGRVSPQVVQVLPLLDNLGQHQGVYFHTSGSSMRGTAGLHSWTSFFSLYLLLLSASFHLYADDSQIYFPLKCTDTHPVQPLLDCLVDTRDWVALIS